MPTPTMITRDQVLSAGNRRMREGDLKALELVIAYKGLPKGRTHWDLLRALRDARPAMRISRAALELYTNLFERTAAQDWHADAVAIVWPSDETLMRELGIGGRRQLKRLFRQLRDASLLAYKDSPNKNRYGRRRRDKTIDLDCTYGIILNSIAGLYPTLLELYTEYTRKRRRIARVARDLRSARKLAEGITEATERYLSKSELRAAVGAYENIETRLAEDPANIEHRDACLQAYRNLNERLGERVASEIKSPLDAFRDTPTDTSIADNSSSERHPKGGQKDPSIISITQPSPSQGKRLSGDESSGNQAPRAQSASGDDRHEGRNPTKSGGDGPSTGAGSALSLDQVIAVVPYKVREDIRDDFSFYQVYDVLRGHAPDYGVSTAVLDEARLAMGRDRACACMAVVMAKRDDLKRPAKYLLGMVAKHRDGELRIERSLFGILAERRKKRSAIEQLRLDGVL